MYESSDAVVVGTVEKENLLSGEEFEKVALNVFHFRKCNTAVVTQSVDGHEHKVMGYDDAACSYGNDMKNYFIQNVVIDVNDSWKKLGLKKINVYINGFKSGFKPLKFSDSKQIFFLTKYGEYYTSRIDYTHNIDVQTYPRLLGEYLAYKVLDASPRDSIKIENFNKKMTIQKKFLDNAKEIKK